MRSPSLFRFLRNRRGVVSIEFAMIAPLFATLLFAFFEMSLLMTRIVLLDDASAQVARFIYTNNDEGMSRADIEGFICDNVMFFENCASNINIEATVIDGFASTPNTAVECRDEGDANFTPSVSFDTGGSSEVMFLRVCITTDLIFPQYGFGDALVKTDNGRFQVVSTMAFANEPF